MSHTWRRQHAELFPKGDQEMDVKLDRENVEYHCASRIGTKRQYDI